MGISTVTKLTERQKQCLRLVSRGAQYKEIAAEIGIAPDTAKNHLKAAMQTLGVSSRYQAARMLADHEAGMTSPLWASPPPTVAEPASGPPGSITPVDAIGSRDTDQVQNTDRMRQEQAVYVANLPNPHVDEPLRIPFIGGVRDDLRPWQILLMCLIAGALSLAAIAALIKVNYEVGLSRHPEQPPATR